MVYDDVREGKYSVVLAFPEKPGKPERPGPSAGAAAYREYADKLEAWEKKHAEYLEARAQWRAEENRMTMKLKADLEEEFGMTGHPKADALWHKAWQDGHSGGYSEVTNIYSDLVELAK